MQHFRIKDMFYGALGTIIPYIVFQSYLIGGKYFMIYIILCFVFFGIVMAAFKSLADGGKDD